MSDSRSIALWLADMAEAIEYILEYTSPFQPISRFPEDRKTLDAVLLNFAILGEAATKIPTEIREAFPAIPFKEMAGLRNRVIHGYFNVSLPILVSTVENDLPEVLKELRDALMTLSQPEQERVT